MRKMFKLLIILLPLISIAHSDECKNVTCPKVPKHYEELGCKPVIPKGKCCPESFDCTDFANRNLTKCFYKGKYYEDGQKIEDPELESSCIVECKCYDGSISCAHIDCPEFFRNSNRENEDEKCVAVYKEFGCCKKRDVCGDDLKSLETCTFNNITYYEGQRINSGESCYSCWCGKNFEDKPVEENKHCRKINCNIDLDFGSDIRKGCVPVYYETEDCCPIEHRCPSSSTSIVKAKAAVAEVNSPQCFFGNLKLSIGDSLSSRKEDCMTCTCKVPPLVTCIKTC